MARALGGSVARAPKAEVGWYEIESNDTTLIPTGPWFEYHWDRWTTPKGATEIAKTDGANQAFVMGRTLGLQFHPEVDPEVLEAWLSRQSGCVEITDEGVPILGICFGGQLMARALGGSVARAPKAEVGWYEIESNDTTLIPTGPWFEYHWDRWTTPKGATEIAKTDGANQAFVMGRTLGLQFHPEVDPEVLEAWLSRESGCVEIRGEGVDLDQLRKETLEQEPGSNKRAAELIDAFLRRVATAAIVAVD
jgi:GMP synthase-like glutamine amidotransferase